ncbi:hypothetical protein FRC09_012348, partial [Ceratobasidium sp. 395]
MPKLIELKLVLSTGLVIPFLFAKRRAKLPPTTVHLSRQSGPAALISRANALTLSDPSSAGRPPFRLLRAKDAERVNEDRNTDTVGAIQHALKAFGVATMLVGAGAGTIFAGVTLGLGITT